MNNTQRKLIKEAYKYGFNSALYEQFVPDLGAPGGFVRDLERLSLQTPPEGSLLSRLQDLFFDSGYSKRQRSILDASLRGPEISVAEIEGLADRGEVEEPTDTTDDTTDDTGAPEPDPREQLIQDLFQYIFRNEGFSPTVYTIGVYGNGQVDNTPTIGYGITQSPAINAYLISQGLDPDAVFDVNRFPPIRITQEQAQDMVEIVLNNNFNTLVTRHDWFGNIHPSAQLVIMDMAYQMGPGFNFPNMFDALSQDPPDYNRAADELLDSRYARDQTPERAQRNADILRQLADLFDDIPL